MQLKRKFFSPLETIAFRVKTFLSKGTKIAQHTLLASTLTMTSCLIEPPKQGEETITLGTTVLIDNLQSPTGLQDDGKGRLYISQLNGKILIYESGTLLEKSFIDIQEKMVDQSPIDEKGLLGFTLHPQFTENGLFYVYYSAPTTKPGIYNSEMRVSEFTTSENPQKANPHSERILLRIDQTTGRHNGGTLAFGPDGMLYISTGDESFCFDVRSEHYEQWFGQDKTNLHGKILRIDVKGDPYTIPEDNPYVDAQGVRPEIWALGFRNPFRMSIDQETGRIFVGDVGQDLREEINLVEKGGNYGWNIREGTTCLNQETPREPKEQCSAVDSDGNPMLDPIIEYPHENEAGQRIGTAIIGGYMYRGQIQELQGHYLYSEYSFTRLVGNGSLFAAEEQNGQWSVKDIQLNNALSGRIGEFIISLGQDRKGEIYVLTRESHFVNTRDGKIHKLTK